MKHTIQGNFISGLELGRCLDRKLVYVRVEQSMSKVMIIELRMYERYTDEDAYVTSTW